jgi:hypothetical protein
MNHKPVLDRVFDDNLRFSFYKTSILVDDSVFIDLMSNFRGNVNMSFTNDVWVLVREES